MQRAVASSELTSAVGFSSHTLLHPSLRVLYRAAQKPGKPDEPDKKDDPDEDPEKEKEKPEEQPQEE